MAYHYLILLVRICDYIYVTLGTDPSAVDFEPSGSGDIAFGVTVE